MRVLKTLECRLDCGTKPISSTVSEIQRVVAEINGDEKAWTLAEACMEAVLNFQDHTNIRGVDVTIAQRDDGECLVSMSVPRDEVPVNLELVVHSTEMPPTSAPRGRGLPIMNSFVRSCKIIPYGSVTTLELAQPRGFDEIRALGEKVCV